MIDLAQWKGTLYTILNCKNSTKTITVTTSSPAFSASPAIIANRKCCGWRVASVRWSHSELDMIGYHYTRTDYCIYLISATKEWLNDTTLSEMIVVWYCYILFDNGQESKGTLHYTSKDLTRSLKKHRGKSRRFQLGHSPSSQPMTALLSKDSKAAWGSWCCDAHERHPTYWMLVGATSSIWIVCGTRNTLCRINHYDIWFYMPIFRTIDA